MSELIQIRVVVAIAAAMVVASLLLNSAAAFGKHARRDHVAFVWLSGTNLAFLMGTGGLLAAPFLPLWLSAMLVILGMLFGMLIGYIALSFAMGQNPKPLNWLALGASLGVGQGVMVLLAQSLVVGVITSSIVNGALGLFLGVRLWRASRPMGRELALLASAPFCAIGLAYLARLGLLGMGWGEYALAVATLLITLLMAFSALQWSFALLSFRATRLTRYMRDARDRAEQASVLKSRLLANMSHELRTPLNGVLGMAQALRPVATDPRSTEMLDMMTDSAEGLMGRLNDILDYSALQSGTLPLAKAPFDLAETIRRAAAPHIKSAQAKGVRFAIDVDATCPTWRMGDQDRLAQILSKLMDNAVNYTSHGQITVSLRAHLDGVGISVADTGAGIDDAQQAQVFDAFVQGDLSATRRVDGAGLGLSIVRSLAEAMGGSVALASRPGQGSVFTVSLPLDVADDSLRPAPAPAPVARVDAPVPTPISRILDILVAEDNKVNQRVLSALLKDTGARLTMVENGLLAVEQAKAQNFDLFLFDIMMPEMDGLTAFCEIRAQLAAQGRAVPPGIALTANVAPEQVAQYHDAGFADVIAKPLRKPDLLAKLTRHGPAAPEPAQISA